MIVLFFLISVFISHSLIKLIQFSINKYRTYLLLRDIPGPEIHFPLFGNLGLFFQLLRNNGNKTLSKEFLKLMSNLSETYGSEKHGLIRLWLGPFMPFIIIHDAKVAQTVLSNSNYLDKASFYSLFRFAVYDGIFTCNTEKWKSEKKMLAEHFKYRALETYVPKADHHLDVLKQRIDNSIEVNNGQFDNFKPVISTYVLDTLGENLFGTQFDSQHTGEPKFVKQVQQLLKICYPAFLQPWNYYFRNVFLRYLVSLSLIRKSYMLIVSFRISIHKIIINRFKAMMKERSSGLTPAGRSCMLDTMISTQIKDSKIVNLNSIKKQLNTFVIAGHDTTTSSVSWTMYLLGHHPEIQQRVREEIDQYLEELNENNEQITVANLKKLTYLNNVIKESLRLYPPGPFIARKGRAPLVINEQITIPANVDVLFLIQHIHTQEKYFKNPLQFFPERFELCKEEPGWVTNAAYMPFVSGLRVCLGRDYALAQQKILFVNLLSRYTFKAMDQYGSTQPNFNFLLSSANFPIQFHKRT